MSCPTESRSLCKPEPEAEMLRERNLLSGLPPANFPRMFALTPMYSVYLRSPYVISFAEIANVPNEITDPATDCLPTKT